MITKDKPNKVKATLIVEVEALREAIKLIIAEIYGVIECSKSETEATVEDLREANKLIIAEIYGVIECCKSETEATVEALREAIKLIK